MKKTLRLQGLDCAHCAAELEEELAALDGVGEVTVAFVSQKLTVEYDSEETLQRVIDIVNNFEEATGVKVPYSIKPRRPGDIATCYSDATKAKEELGWVAENGIREMCEDSWRWQKNNPNGYED